MIVSPFTPLFFGTRKTDGIESDYIQTFASTDKILLQIFVNPEELPIAFVYQQPSGKALCRITFNQWDISPDLRLYFTEICLNPGYYSIQINGYGTSDVFRVTDDRRILDRTTLIQYSMKDNRQRTDTMFFIDGMRYFFDFRVHGGFKDKSWSFSVDGEQFVTPTGDISQLYGMATTQKIFTMGGSIGVPVQFGEMLNLILTCSHVYFDGVKYSRKESNTPEISEPLEGINSFVFSQTLQKSTNLDPFIEQRNHIAMRRLDSEYRSISSSVNRKI
ncbi:MAG: hypothetical protein K2M59_03960 [Muribaculaceae bacterium]|nr:hypothetical protein [Muribaculaceae bacterium]MDE7465566.1 hypothetical protein [Muribaculaceae bacterium]